MNIQDQLATLIKNAANNDQISHVTITLDENGNLIVDQSEGDK